MKNFFEYPVNEKIRQELLIYYNDVTLKQHNRGHVNKTILKLDRIKKCVNFSPNDDVLDIGCSRGELLFTIGKNIHNGVGIDIAESIIHETQLNNKAENLQFRTFNGKNFEDNERFTKIIMMDVLEHSIEPDALMKIAYDKLSGKGLVIVQVPFSGWLSEIIYGKYHQGHLRYYDPQYLKTYLEKFNFSVQKIVIYNSVPAAATLLKVKQLWKLLNKLVNMIPNKIYPYFGEIIIVGEKKSIQ